MSSLQYLEVVIYFLILTELTSFLLSFVLWSFQVLGKDSMDYGIRSGKSLSLGMPRKASPLSSSKLSVYLTRSYIFIRHMICVLLGASCMIWVLLFSLPQSSLLYTPFGRDTHESKFIIIIYVLHLYLLS